MDLKNYIDTFRKLVELANRLQFENPEVHEPWFFAVLAYISKSNPFLQREVEQEFIRMLKIQYSEPELYPHSLIGYCMRELQFKELKMEIEQQFRRAKALPDHRAIPVLRHMLEDYAIGSSPYKDELYQYYLRDNKTV